MLETWTVPALLGLGLAAATGLRAFLPLLVLALVARFGLLGVELKPEVAWLTSDTIIAGLAIAAAVEFVGDKIPWLDRVLNALGYIIRPAAAVLAVYAIFRGFDPMMAALAALVIGAPTALAFNAAQGGKRLKREGGVKGWSNAAVGLVVDLLATVGVVVALIVPTFSPVLVAVLLLVVFWLARRAVKRTRGDRPAHAGDELSTQLS